jgi:hypothetical protein
MRHTEPSLQSFLPPILRLAALGAAIAAVGGCKVSRTEYRTRPAFYNTASETPLPDEFELADGTRVVYREDRPQGFQSADPDAELFKIREEKGNGAVILRCILPEHVIANTMTCLRNEEYDLIWEQLLARSTRDSYSAQGLGFDDFREVMEEQRPELMTTLNRMGFGFFGPDVVLDRGAGGAVRARFGPRLSDQFQFQYVDMVMETDGMKLLLIH